MRYIILLTIIWGINSINMQAQDTAVATFGGGCFWCTEAIFLKLKGVDKVESGYSGGESKNPTYKEICTGLTGHAEVIHITYQPALIEFEDLLEVFFATHDPTTLNRQGADVGTQYRSVVFYHNEQQKSKSEFIIQELNRQSAFDDPIVTEVSAFDVFYPAEGYHQDYYSNNKNQPYCRAVVGPKVEKFKKAFSDILKD
ncbi:peptide-methionine (S)-S-oxide reductase MsrA [Carboxylicivirga sp. N1Y90]|uniref:peptide-methionine (S)-S-oxide reductase MsrA n=1 Tax=Carboxylicivirga fragile TaxID=3417571 RepID=UPI003D334E8D|nr:peptide-methionine (S)-S-oxide reductase MsrA [Marinilabiliaceae bacterium N1Y90]